MPPKDFSQCLDISDRSCVKVACKCPLGTLTEWYTGPEPKRCRLCTCVATSTKPTSKPTSTVTSTTPTLSSSSQIIYPSNPPPATTTSSCPETTATPAPTTCSRPANLVVLPSSVISPGTATVCARAFCFCPIYDCFCTPPAVQIPKPSGACMACECSTATKPLLDPSAKPNLAVNAEDQSIVTTAFADTAPRHQETPAADSGTVLRKRVAMPKITQN
jgi:hypothetical protein